MDNIFPNNKYIVRSLGTNKTQLLHQIRPWKLTPQAPLAEIFVPKPDWQKYNQIPAAHDDFYAQSSNTSFGPNQVEDNTPD